MYREEVNYNRSNLFWMEEGSERRPLETISSRIELKSFYFCNEFFHRTLSFEPCLSSSSSTEIPSSYLGVVPSRVLPAPLGILHTQKEMPMNPPEPESRRAFARFQLRGKEHESKYFLGVIMEYNVHEHPAHSNTK